MTLYYKTPPVPACEVCPSMSCDRHDPNRPGWIWTIGGARFWPLDPRPQDVAIEDIAHALSMSVRFSGHVQEHYSVAEHSVRVSDVVASYLPRQEPRVILAGLLHDAAEAYLADLSRPVKRGEELVGVWPKIEGRVHDAIMRRFGVPALAVEEDAAVKRADDILARTEMRDLPAVKRPPVFMGGHTPADTEPLRERIIPWSQPVAKRIFLERFLLLTF